MAEIVNVIDPIHVGRESKDIIKRVLQQLTRDGIRFRTKEQMERDVLVLVQSEMKNTQIRMEDLRGDLMDFLKAERSDSECQHYKDTYRCPRDCGLGGKLWGIFDSVDREGRYYFVWYQECGLHRAWRDKQAAERERKTEEASIASGFKRQR